MRSGRPRVSASRRPPFWERHFLRIDTFGALSCGLLSIVGLHFLVGDQSVRDALQTVRGTFYGAVATTSAALLGFAIAVLPLLQTLLSLRPMRYVRANPHAHELFSSFFHAILALGLLSGVSLAAIVFDRDTASHVLFPYVVVVLGWLAIWKLTRSIWTLRLVLRIVAAAEARSTTSRSDTT